MKKADLKKSGTPPPVPGALRLARLCWLLAGALFLGFAANLFFTSSRAATTASGPWFLAALLTVVGGVAMWLAVRLWRSDPAARTQLTWIGLITALPLFLRFGRYSLLAALVLIAVGLMWTPASIKYFRSVSKPKAGK